MASIVHTRAKECMKNLGYTEVMKDGTALRNAYARAAQVRIPSAAAVDAFMDTLAGGVACPNKHFRENHNANVPWLLLYPAQGHTSTNAAAYARRYFGAVLDASWNWRFTFVNAALRGKRVYRAFDNTGWDGTQAFVDGGNGTRALRCVPGDAIRPGDPAGSYGYEVWPHNAGVIPNVTNFFGNIDKPLHQQARAWAYGCQVKVANVADINNPSVNGTPLYVAQVGHDPHATPAFSGNNNDRYVRQNGSYTNIQYQGWPLYASDGDFTAWQLIPVGEWMWVVVVGVSYMWRHEADFWGIFGGGKIPFNKAPYAITEAQFDQYPLPEPPPPDGSTPTPAPPPAPPPGPPPFPVIDFRDTDYRTQTAAGTDTDYSVGDFNPGSGVTSVSASPTAISFAFLSGSQQITPTVVADAGVSTAVTYSITGSAATVSSSGLVEPVQAGSAVVKVSADADPTKFALVQVVVSAGVVVASSQLLGLTRLPMRTRGYKG